VDVSWGVQPPGISPVGGSILPGAFPTTGSIAPWPPVGSEAPARPPKNLVGGRLSWDDVTLYGAGMPIILPPDDTADSWRRLDLDADSLRNMPAHRLLHVLAEASPDVSRALWDFLRLTNPGWECKAYVPGTRTPNVPAQAVIDDWLRRLRKRYGSIDVPIGRLHFGAFLRGAIMSELVLDTDGRTAVDLATPDPLSARFKQAIDPVLGRVWLLGQFHHGQWTDLSVRETISYIPIDPAPASPYGRPPAAPSIFASLFLLGLLHDLRRVVAQQGYPRYDIAVSMEALRKATPPNILNSPTEWKAWVDATIAEVQRAYNALEPDSAFVHTDVVVVNRPQGAVSAEALGGIEPLIKGLERQLARGLKTMPLLMGMIEGQSEANANRQWELQAAGVKAIQHLSEADLSEKAQLVCEAQGIPADVEWRFAELRAAERYRDAMTDGLVIDNATKLWNAGIIGQKEFADMTTGEPADQDTPRFMPSNTLTYEAAMTTNSARGDSEPAVAKDKKPDKENTGGAGGESGDSQDPNARMNDLVVRWPEMPKNGHTNGRTNGHHRITPDTFKPPGMPLAYVPADVPYDAGDQRRLLRAWDRAVPEMAGLLDARPVGEADPRSFGLVEAAQALREASVELRQLVAATRPTPPPPSLRIVRKEVERDDNGRIVGVREVHDAIPDPV